MKKLYLKSGIYFDVKVIPPAENKKNRTIEIYDEAGIKIIIEENGPFHSSVTFVKSTHEFYIVSAVAEIINNFDFYFNNLNQ